jgi:hypothetical protein
MAINPEECEQMIAACQKADLHESRRYRVYGESAWIGMDPAFTYDNFAK